jgi:SAM-dependent methyltransferase
MGVVSPGDPMSSPEDRAYAEQLLITDVLIAPVNRAAIAVLQLASGSRGLDAGCGIGLQAIQLAEAVGPSGRVVGVDSSSAMIAEARARAEAADLAGRLCFEVSDARDLPFGPGEFDWAWSANCVGYGLFDPVAAVGELARAVRPGGLVALLVWSSQSFLPGYPRLEARLNATTPGLAPFTLDLPPEQHHLRDLGVLRSAGLVELHARTFIGEAHAPLGGEERGALAALLAMRWPGAEAELSPEDSAGFRRLCAPGSPEYILDHPDYHAWFAESLFWGRVAG